MFLQIPVFQRGGTVIPLKTTAGKSTEWMIDTSYELRVALDTEVLWDSVPFLQRCLLLHLIFVGPCYLFSQHNGIWVLNGSSPLVLFEGTQTSPLLSPLSMIIWAQQRQNIFLTFFTLSSPLEEGAENGQATNFLLGTERELPTAVFANKEVTLAPAPVYKTRLSSTFRAGLPEPSRDTSH